MKGLYREVVDGRDGHIYVNRGAGYWGPPMRLGSPPEITKLILTS
jgi:predicted MPP superfamily phosphohydrolase